VTDTVQDFKTLLIDVDRGVATVTLNRPPRNEYTGELGAELQQAFVAFESDDAIRAIVVTGAGDFFCAGAALAGRAQPRPEGEGNGEGAAAGRARPDGPRLKPWEMATPIIAAINGPAVGVGLTLPTQWDIRIAADDAKMGYVFIRRGWVAELGAHWLLPRLVGASRAMELLLTGRIFTGSEAAEMGLVSKAVPKAEVLPAALDVAHEIADNCPPVSVALTKRLVWQMLEETSHETAQATDNRVYGWTVRQPDGREGVKAFLEKRPGEWSMSKTNDIPEDLL
jgi:enoyl-CoA hydratase/carnithine racemase